MNVKGLIVSAVGDTHKMYECEISVPALKIHLNEQYVKSLVEIMPQSKYTNIIFMIEGNPVEVSIHAKEGNNFYANAKEIAQLNLTRLPILKENTLVMKFIENQEKKQTKKKAKTI